MSPFGDPGNSIAIASLVTDEARPFAAAAEVPLPPGSSTQEPWELGALSALAEGPEATDATDATDATGGLGRDRNTDRLACLLEVAHVINSSLELDAVMESILTHARRILDAESGSIMLMDETPGQLRVHAAQGPRAGEIQGKMRKLGEGVAGWVALHGKPLLLHGQTSDRRFKQVVRRTDVRDALCVPLKAKEAILGVISLSNRRSDEPFSSDDLTLLNAIAHQAALTLRNARSFDEMQRQRRTVERLLGEVTRAQEEERKRIALQIHDGPAQTLFAALRNLETVQACTAAGDVNPADAFRELEHAIRCAINETRALMIDLRPPCLDDMGLHAALRRYAQQFTQRTQIKVELKHQGPRRFPPMVESALYRIAQESLTNVWKHAKARKVVITLHVGLREGFLSIQDDGVGFDLDEASARQGEHLGLSSLRDRSEMIGGRLTVRSEAGKGALISVTIPFTEAELQHPPEPDQLSADQPGTRRPAPRARART